MKLRSVLYQEEKMWVAQGLEHDIRAQAPTLEELAVRWAALIEAEKRECKERGVKPFEGIGRAPDSFFKMLESRAGTYTPANVAHPPEMALCA